MKTNDKQISIDEDLIKPSSCCKNSLTPALFKTYEGCEHYTDMEAVEIIISLEKLSAISYNLLHNSDPIIIDNQQVVYLNPLQEIKLQAT